MTNDENKQIELRDRIDTKQCMLVWQCNRDRRKLPIISNLTIGYRVSADSPITINAKYQMDSQHAV